MAPEYGATCGIFPVDAETLSYLRLTGRPEEQVRLVEAYMKEQGLFHDASTPAAEYSDTLELDLGDVEPSVAGPKRPQDRVPLSGARGSFDAHFPDMLGAPASSAESRPSGASQTGNVAVAERTEVAKMDWEGSANSNPNGPAKHVRNGSVVIAAITSCTNTSNPSVMVAAGLVAKKAHELGISVKPWVKTSMAPGSRVVTSYLKQSGLLEYLEKQKFNVVGYGCTTCIGNSGPLPEDISKKVNEENLAVVSVLSGNRNFEGRINADVKANYLMSPPLVVAYALAGTIDIDLRRDPLGKGADGRDVFLSDVWPTQKEIGETVASCVQSEMFRTNYADVFKGDEKWEALDSGESERYAWDANSTYIKRAPYFDGMSREAPESLPSLAGLRVLAILGDSVTTDHISPAGSIKAKSPAGEYLTERNVPPHLFNSYGSRRGNHEVMVRGTFANIRLRNQLAPGTEGGFTTYLPTGEVVTIFEAAMRYQETGTGLIVLAGKEYGSGSSRDWAAKGPALLGVRVVIAESFERIHRSNLVGMGVLPLQFRSGESAASLGLTGKEIFEVAGLLSGLDSGFASGREVEVVAAGEDGRTKAFAAICRIDTPQEIAYYRHGGILQYVLRQLL
jgi:aconitate hydratase